MNRTLALLGYLATNPGWHFGLDLVALKPKICSRWTIYQRLHALQEAGFVERSDDMSGTAVAGFPRPRYRFRSQSTSKGDT